MICEKSTTQELAKTLNIALFYIDMAIFRGALDGSVFGWVYKNDKYYKFIEENTKKDDEIVLVKRKKNFGFYDKDKEIPTKILSNEFKIDYQKVYRAVKNGLLNQIRRGFIVKDEQFDDFVKTNKLTEGIKVIDLQIQCRIFYSTVRWAIRNKKLNKINADYIKKDDFYYKFVEKYNKNNCL